jgi:hypothetical protein
VLPFFLILSISLVTILETASFDLRKMNLKWQITHHVVIVGKEHNQRRKTSELNDPWEWQRQDVSHKKKSFFRLLLQFVIYTIPGICF